jgi:hypothetical protein
MMRKISSRTISTQKIVVVSLFVVIVMAFAVAPNAQADSITYELSVANPNLASQGSGPYADVTVASVGSTGMLWSVSATALNNFVFGSNGAIALNVNLANAGIVALLIPTCSMSPCAQDVAGHNDGFGTFTLIVNDGPGFSSGGYSDVSFQFTTSKATTISNLLIANSNGSTVSAHMASSFNTPCTGYAADAGKNDASGPTQYVPCFSTPEPNSLSTAGIGMIGLLLLLGSRRLVKGF